jgi:hypothetical protein
MGCDHHDRRPSCLLDSKVFCSSEVSPVLASRRCLLRDQCLGSYVVFVPSVVNTVYDCRLRLILSLTYSATTRLCHIKMTDFVCERLLFDLLVREMSFGMVIFFIDQFESFFRGIVIFL